VEQALAQSMVLSLSRSSQSGNEGHGEVVDEVHFQSCVRGTDNQCLLLGKRVAGDSKSVKLRNQFAERKEWNRDVSRTEKERNERCTAVSKRREVR
jgi:hypothetical protein